MLNCGNMCWWFTDAEKMSLSHLTQKFFMLFLVAPVSLQCVTSGIAISHRGAYAPNPCWDIEIIEILGENLVDGSGRSSRVKRHF